MQDTNQYEHISDFNQGNYIIALVILMSCEVWLCIDSQSFYINMVYLRLII